MRIAWFRKPQRGDRFVPGRVGIDRCSRLGVIRGRRFLVLKTKWQCRQVGVWPMIAVSFCLSVAPPGLIRMGGVQNQGLAPLAAPLRPFGAGRHGWGLAPGARDQGLRPWLQAGAPLGLIRMGALTPLRERRHLSGNIGRRM